MPGLFICYEKVRDGLARITSTATVIEHSSYAAQLTEAGQKFYFVPMDGFTGFFELDENDEVVAIDTRQEFPNKFDKTTIGILETATLRDVPPTQVEVEGGFIHGTIDHPGGDLLVRFALTGEYTLTFEAFPSLRCTVVLTVESSAAENSGVSP